MYPAASAVLLICEVRLALHTSMFQQHMSEPNPFINEAAKLIRGNKENWKEEALDNPQLYGMSPDTYQLFLN